MSYPWNDEPELSVKRQQLLEAARAKGFPRIDLPGKRKDWVGPGEWPWTMFVEQEGIERIEVAWKSLKAANL